MKEVEVKIELENIQAVQEILEAQGCQFSDPLIQRDLVYIPTSVPTVPCPAGTNVLRIRMQEGMFLLTLKRSDPGNHLSKLEHELEISSFEEMDKIIKLLDFKLVADTTKTRQKCKINGYEICLDEVNNLGKFLEIEKMTDQDPSGVQQEMIAFLQGLGVDTSKRMTVGYDVLWVQKHTK